MTFILGREIVSEALRSGDLRPYLDAGLTLEFMEDSMHPACTSVFTLQDYDAWMFILRHHEAHGRVPDISLFRHSFPEPTYALSAARSTAAELVSMARTAINQFETEVGSSEASRYIDAGDPVTAAKIMMETAERVLSQPASLPFRVLSLDELLSLPDPEFLIDGILDHGTVSMLAGESGKGKSFVAIDWALHVATGRRWSGRKVRKGRVLYVAAEGALGIKKRVAAWLRTHGEIPAGSFELVRDPVQLAESVPLQALVRYAKDFDFVVIDTLARTSAGLEENSAKDMGRYVDALYKIRNAASEAGNTTLVVHHTGYDTKRQRGSSSLYANIDGQVMIESDDPHDVMRMKVTKRKDGEIGTQLAMCLVQVEIGGGATSCIVRELEMPEVELSPREQVLAALTDEYQTTRDLEAATGLPNSTVDREVRALVREERALTAKAGRNNANAYRLP